MKRNHFSLVTILCILMVFVICGEQLFPGPHWEWVEIDTPTKPTGRMGHEMVYDSARDVIVLFGGEYANDREMNDTWEYGLVQSPQGYVLDWTHIPTSTKPRTRDFFGMVYDSKRHAAVAFGGEDWPAALNDTWVYDGVNWTQVATSGSPGQRAHLNMAYDEHNEEIVMYGGWQWYNTLDDFWRFKWTAYPASPPQGVWSFITPEPNPPSPTKPPKCQNALMVYDQARKKVVLYGGSSHNQGIKYQDTWEWDGVKWEKMNPVDNPGKLEEPAGTYDSTRERVILFGGNGLNGTSDDLWEYDGVNWKKMEVLNTPGKRSFTAIVYHPLDEKVVLFGGRKISGPFANDTWELRFRNEPPVPICKQNITLFVDENCEAYITAEELNDGSYDPDEMDTFTLSIDNPGPFQAGQHEVTLTAIDNHDESASCTTTITVVDNIPPVLNQPELPVLEGECSVTVSSIPKAMDNCAGEITGTTNDPLSYTEQGTYSITWLFDDGNENTVTQSQQVIVNDTTAPVPELPNLPAVSGQCGVNITEFPNAMDNCSGEIIGTTNDPLIYSQQGTYTVNWQYKDEYGNTSFQTQTVIVKDATPPIITSLTASPNILWSPNHKMIPVSIDAVVQDNCDSNPITTIYSISSNEPVNGTGDGDTAPDWEITGSNVVYLRAERSAKGSGRVYTITVKCTDINGLSSYKDVTVTVPHDKKNK